MANNFNDNANKKNLNGSDISYTTYRTNYSNDEMMKDNGGVPSGGGSSNLEDNKEATIDVSTYTEPVEIEPTAGKDGMAKATVTLTNIPQPSIYLWRRYNYGSEQLPLLLPFAIAPLDIALSDQYPCGYPDSLSNTQAWYKRVWSAVTSNYYGINRVSDTQIDFLNSEGNVASSLIYDPATPVTIQLLFGSGTNSYRWARSNG